MRRKKKESSGLRNVYYYGSRIACYCNILMMDSIKLTYEIKYRSERWNKVFICKNFKETLLLHSITKQWLLGVSMPDYA